MKNEIFKDIPEYEGIYQISNLGRVKSLKRIMPNNNGYGFRTLKERILKNALGKKGYFKIQEDLLKNEV